MIYNSSSDGLQTGEMSRYLYQLKYESNFDIQEKSLHYDINITQPKEIRIKKSDEVVKRFDQYLTSKGGTKYLSPSALNTYMRCSLQFYFRYIARLREEDDITEEIDAPLFGNILHEAMDFLYQDFLNKEVTKEDLESLKKNKSKVEESIDHAFGKEYFKNKKFEYSGKNIIIRDIIEKYIYQIIKIDLSIAPFKILSLEDTYKIEIPVTVNGAFDTITLGGKIDRVDELNNHIRIIDYKTGGDKLEFKNIEALFSDKKADRKDAVFQTFLYAKFYKDLKKPNQAITPGVYSVRKIFDNNFDYRIKQKENRSKNLR